MARKDFHRHNDAFICQRCGSENPPALDGERNHCKNCLYSLHVDATVPGDRLSPCHGLMEPTRLEYKGAKGFMIVHRCVKCAKEMSNSLAEDDSRDNLNRFSP